MDRLAFADLQRYVDARFKEIGKRGRLNSPVTIRKERTSLSGVWAWATRMSLGKTAFPNKELRHQKSDEKPPFQAWAEIERRIKQSELSGRDLSELWEGLFLTAAEIEQTLDFVESNVTRH